MHVGTIALVVDLDLQNRVVKLLELKTLQSTLRNSRAAEETQHGNVGTTLLGTKRAGCGTLRTAQGTAVMVARHHPPDAPGGLQSL
jgi:hypothetical protein